MRRAEPRIIPQYSKESARANFGTCTQHVCKSAQTRNGWSIERLYVGSRCLGSCFIYWVAQKGDSVDMLYMMAIWRPWTRATLCFIFATRLGSAGRYRQKYNVTPMVFAKLESPWPQTSENSATWPLGGIRVGIQTWRRVWNLRLGINVLCICWFGFWSKPFDSTMSIN